MKDRLTARGPNVKDPARLPSLQAMRLPDSQTQRAFEALREWVEVRLGSRGDAYEKAVTLREFEQVIEPIQKYVAKLGSFQGTVNTLRPDLAEALPTDVVNGGFVGLTDGTLYYGVKGVWRRVSLV